MPAESEQIRQIFDNYGIPLSTEWLESCIEWCKNDNLPPNYTLRNLQNMVYEQWLILDLRDVEIPSLPRNLSLEKKYSLSGVYYLQLMQVIDISKPKLWQLQRIRNNVARNTELEKDFGKRVLQLTLTDGVQEIQAMEFKPIACLNLNLAPGTKLKIMGSIMVRNGRLMLQQENVKNLGGSVDDLIVSNAAENVLARALQLEETLNPHVFDEKILDVTEGDANTQLHTRTLQNFNAPNQNMDQNRLANTSENIARNTQNISTSNRSNNDKQIITNKKIPPEFEVDYELLRELEEDFEENSVRHFNKVMSNNNRVATQSFNNTGITNTIPNLEASNSDLNSKTPSNRACSSPDLFEEIEFDDELLNKHFDQINTECNMDKSTVADTGSRNNSVLSNRRTDENFSHSSRDAEQVANTLDAPQAVAISSSGRLNKPKGTDEVITLDDSFDDIDIDAHLDHIEEEMANLPCSTQKIRDFKEHVKSPELKRATPKLSLSKPMASKKLTQSKLTFPSSTASKTLPDTSNYDIDSDDDFEKPFSIFAKSAKKKPSNFVPLDIPGVPPKTPGLSSTSKLLSGISPSKCELKNPPEQLSGQVTNEQLRPSKINVMSIEKLKKLLPNVSKGKFKIRGKFKVVAEKLKATKTTLYLAITVLDQTGELTVEVHTDVVANYAGIKPEKLAELSALAARNDKVAALEISQALRKLHTRCISLDNVLELQITRGEKYPVVINVIEEP